MSREALDDSSIAISNSAGPAFTHLEVSARPAVLNAQPPSIPDHELLGLIGVGSYGEVWLARNALGSLRAVKVVHRKSFDHDKPYEREFEGLKQFEPISHARESQVDIFHVGRNDDAGFFYYIMELADAVPNPNDEIRNPKEIRDPNTEAAGPREAIRASDFGLPSAFGFRNSDLYVPRTLKHDLRTRGALPVPECVRISLSLARALEHLHAHGLVHRDIKPSNIIFVNGVPKLADIGLVTSVDATRSFVGTDGYIPPEGPGTPPADLYSLGKVLYECVTGKDRLDFPELPADWRTRPDFDQLLEFNEILTKACDADVRERYQTAEQVAAELLMLQHGQSVKTKRAREQRWSFARRLLRAGTRVQELALAATAFGKQISEKADIQSVIPEVNNLVEKGHICALGATQERLRQAGKYFVEAADLEPGFLPAHVGVFRVRMLELTALPRPPADAVSNIQQAANKLMETVPQRAEGLIAASLLKFLEGRLKDALADAQTAARMPSCCKQTRAVVHALNGFYLLNCGRPEPALRHFKISEREVPTCAILQVYLGHPRFVRHQFDFALTQYQHAVELEPRQCLGYAWKAKVFEERGEILEAIEMSEQADLRALEDEARLNAAATPLATDAITTTHNGLRESFRRHGAAGYWRRRLENALGAPTADAHYVATVYARLGQVSDAYQWLTKALEQGALSGLCFDLCWDRRDRRFQKVARQVGLVC
ncbi:MAG: serine/threonine protein kinase [Verrucomicrobia bacterium]|nr:serine/threonine protein kinase [Verrucomicrobiota bacterium]